MEDGMIEIDLDGKVVGVPRDVVSALAAAAAARANVSGRHRDLSLQLNRALESGRVSLGQDEIRALCAVLEEEHPDRFGPAAAELLRAVA
jgi:ABC-type amino acid transport substrate-binding protein